MKFLLNLLAAVMLGAACGMLLVAGTYEGLGKPAGEAAVSSRARRLPQDGPNTFRGILVRDNKFTGDYVIAVYSANSSTTSAEPLWR